MQAIAQLQRMSSDVQRLASDGANRIEAALDEPEDAAQVVTQEYAPLLNRRLSAESLLSDGHLDTPGQTLPVRVRKLELVITYAAFFILGSTILLPWNAIIVAQTYFASRLIGSPYEYSFASYVALTFMMGNLVFLAHATYTQQSAKPLLRILGSIMTIAGVLVIFCLSTSIDDLDANGFFFAMIVLVAIASAGASYLQNAVVALSALFGPSYLQGILSGQGAIGFIVSVVQLVIAAGTASTGAGPNVNMLAGGLDDYADSIRKTAFAFFLVSSILAGFALACHLILIRLPFYRLRVRSNDEDKEVDKDSGSAEPVSMRDVERKIRILGLAIFFVFFVTLAVFPAITASITSVHTPDPSQGINFYSPTIFIPFHFVVFNLGDWLGRAAPSLNHLRFTSIRKLVLCSLIRVGFIPLFLLCNVTGVPAGHHTVIASDSAYLLILLTFAFSNGYISTLIMIAGVQLPILDKAEVDLAATVLAFYLTSGLAAGSLASFAVRASVCRCNPFLQG